MRARRYFALSLVATACGSVSESDPAWWSPTKDPGGTHYQLDGTGTGGVALAAGGSTGTSGAGGSDVQPPASGGMPFGGGGAAGQAGPGGSDQRGSGGLNAGTGGLGPGSGGSEVGSGGMNAGSGGMNVGSGGTTGGNSGKCTFTFDVTTSTANGRYQPSNAGAVWITDAQNRFVKTLRTWSYLEIQQVTAWTQASNRNTVDAITSATRRSHGALAQTLWDCTDVSHAAVADGKYTVHVSFAEADASVFVPVIQASVDFTKSPAGADVMGQDTANFKSMHAKLTVP